MADLEYRFAPVEYRADGDGPGSLAGVVMPYNVEARIGAYREKFEPGSLRLADRVLCNWQHDRAQPLAVHPGGGLTLTDSATALRAELVLPNTSAGRDVAELAKTKVLSGFSLEFRAVRDSVIGGCRVVHEAILAGIAIVDSPAYSEAAIDELRARIDGHAPPRRRYWI